MKLSKTKLKEALAEASMECPKDIFNDALVSFFEGTLEIEGYERSQWVKFDPDDPKTFPPDDGKNVLGYNPEYSDEPFECFLGVDDNFYCPQDKIRFPLPTHWRPLPPPGKEEA